MCDEAGGPCRHCQSEREFLWAALRALSREVAALKEREDQQDALYRLLTGGDAAEVPHPRNPGLWAVN
jgi:hypothetical protein